MTPCLDAHAHLWDPRFDADRDAVLLRAWEAGLSALVNVGVDLPTSELVVAAAAADRRLPAVVGVHPHEARAWCAETSVRLRALAAAPGVVGLGETGLDFYYDRSPRDDQRRAFRAQLDLADDLGLPVVVHSRDAEAETVETLLAWAEGGRRAGTLGMMHCYSYGPESALRLVAAGFTISFSGTLTYPRNDAVREAARAVPDTAVLLETDAPYLPPQGRRGRRNEPAYMLDTLTTLAGLRGVEPAAIAALTAANAAALFRLDAVGAPP